MRVSELRDRREIEKAVAEEAVNSRRFYSREDDKEPGHRNYRQIFPGSNDTRSLTDLTYEHHKKMQEVALWLYQSNPVAHRYVEMIKDFVIGDGVRVIAEEDRVQEALDAFWHHPANDMEDRLPKLCTELSIYGEIFLAFFIERDTDILRLSYISPSWIEGVRRDSNDVSHHTQVLLKRAESSSEGVVDGPNTIDLLRYDEFDGMLVGDGIYQAVNTVSDSTRGISDLFPISDAMANLDTFIFNVAERARHMTNWFYDITYEGSNEKQQRDFMRKLLRDGIYPGAFQIHNEKVSMETKSVNLQADETSKLYETFFGMLVTGLGIPPHWTGLVSQMGRAGAEPMQEPAYKKLITRQSILRRFTKKLLNYQLDYLIRRGILDRNVNRAFVVEMPKIAIRDFQRLGGAVNRVAEALLKALEQDVYTKEEIKDKIDKLFRILEDEVIKEQGG